MHYADDAYDLLRSNGVFIDWNCKQSKFIFHGMLHLDE